ncbi:MAG: Hsp70 family protein, partial [Bradymonadaceae bacterium]
VIPVTLSYSLLDDDFAGGAEDSFADDGFREDEDDWLDEGGGGGEGGDGPLLIDVTPHALGIATVGGVMDIIIERNGSLPLERSRSFSTSKDNQTRVVLPIYAGNSRRIEENRELGVLELQGIEPRPREQVEIQVTFSVDTDGMLSVSATDLQTGRAQSAELSILGETEGDFDDLDEDDFLDS